MLQVERWVKGGDSLHFAAWMRETRIRKGLTTSECAVRAGVTQPAWSEWEQSGPEKEWRKATIRKIAAGLDESLYSVMHNANMLPAEEPDMEAGRRLGPILALAAPSKRVVILDMLEEVARRAVKMAAA